MRLLMAGSFAAMFNLYVSLTALPVYIVQSGGSLFDAGLVSAAGIFAQIGFRFLFGPMADSRGRRLPLLLGSAAFALAPLGYLLSPSTAASAVVRVFQAIGPAALLGAGSALAVDLSPPHLRATGLGALSAAKSLGVALATPVALAVAAARGFSAVFWLGFAVGLVGLGTMAFLREPEGTKTRGAAGKADAAASYKSRWATVALLSAALVGGGFLGCFVLFGSIIDDVVGSGHRGLVFAVQENGVDLGMGLGALVFGALVTVTGYGEGFLLLGVFSVGWAAVVRPWLGRLVASEGPREEPDPTSTNP